MTTADAARSLVPLEPASLPPLPPSRAAGRGDWAWRITPTMVAAAVALPIVVVLSHLVVPAGEVWAHLVATVLPRYLENTFVLLAIVTLGVLVVGTSTAWLVTMCRFPGSRLFQWALLLPLAAPAYVIAYTYTGLLDYAGPVQSLLRHSFGWGPGDYWFPPIRSLGGAAAMFVLVLYPYVYLLARAAFLEQSVCVLEASRTLGAGPWESFFRVGLPLARPAVAAGVALAAMETFNDFGTVQFFGVDTFTTGIYRTWLGLGQQAAAAQLAAVLVAFVVALLLLERWSRAGARFEHTTTRYRALPVIRLEKGRAALAFLACLTPLALGFLVPAAVLLLWVAREVGRIFTSHFFVLAANSFVLAAAASAFAVGLAFVMAYGLRLTPTPAARVAARLAALGYAVPGAVIAVGLLIPFAWFDNTLDSVMRETFGLSTGLVLSGTIAALLFAYVVRFFGVSFNAIEAGFAKIPLSMDGAARTLGRSPGEVLRHIHAPMMGGTALTAAILVFVDVLKELPATLIIRPFNFDTLAIRAHELASTEFLALAAGPALAIVAVGLVPVILLSRMIAHARPGAAMRRGIGG